MEEKRPTHRSFRFSLRTLLIWMAAISVLLAVFAYPLHWIRARQAFLLKHGHNVIVPFEPSHIGGIEPQSAPWPLGWYFESGIAALNTRYLTEEEAKEAVGLFPEAQIIRIPGVGIMR